MKVHYQSRLDHADNDKQVLNKQIQALKEQLSSAESLHTTEAGNWQQKIETLEKELSNIKEKLLKSIEEQKTQRQVSCGCCVYWVCLSVFIHCLHWSNFDQCHCQISSELKGYPFQRKSFNIIYMYSGLMTTLGWLQCCASLRLFLYFPVVS